MFQNIPQEMRNYAQFVVWRYEDVDSNKPTKVPYSPKLGTLASVTDPSTWGSFDDAMQALSKSNWFSGIGFVLTENDPYAFIDLDDTKGDQSATDKQLRIYQEFDSYAEKSPSGKGLHIIVKGKLESGRRRSNIEIYSSQRYMTMTGDVYRNKPIVDYNELLNVLWGQMGNGSVAATVYAGLAEQKDSDEVIIGRAIGAANGQKFQALHYGQWQDHYPSQSEADFAYIDMLAFYTQNRAQIARLFKASGLGQRDKAKRADYVHYMLNKSFDRMLPPVDIDGLRNQLTAILDAKAKVKDTARPGPRKPVKVDSSVYSIPPGLVGKLAQFIYAAAPRPVPEIALAGAIGLVAGIVGRSYNVSGTGLNQYVLLLAPTGTGKEAIATGIDRLMNAVIRTVPSSVDFIGPGEIASPQALIKYMSKTANSFVSIVGEFGMQLQQMGSASAAPHLIGLRRMLLDLYNKSGEGKTLKPSIYSDREKNTNTILAPALTLIGESTPEKYYEALHEGMISEGLLPRFTTIEYHGDRVALNEAHAQARPSFDTVEQLATLCAHSLMLNSQHKAINVLMSPEAKNLYDEFNKHCDLNINTSDREIRRHLWNRAHIKAMKLGALVAVGCNPYDPLISLEVAEWSKAIIIADVRNLLERFDTGEIGIDNDESKQMAALVKLINFYLMNSWQEIAKYSSGSAQLHDAKIFPYSYAHKRGSQIGVFRQDRAGATFAIKRAFKNLVERGDLEEISRATLLKDYRTQALCYAISNPKSFGI